MTKLGIDLGKNSCSVVGSDGIGRVALRRRVQREGSAGLLERLPARVALLNRSMTRIRNQNHESTGGFALHPLLISEISVNKTG